jgi:hypothetical protein
VRDSRGIRQSVIKCHSRAVQSSSSWQREQLVVRDSRGKFAVEEEVGCEDVACDLKT